MRRKGEEKEKKGKRREEIKGEKEFLYSRSRSLISKNERFFF